MDTFTKKQRDLAMKILCDYHANRVRGHSITPEYLYHHGLPESVNAGQLVAVLESMGYLTVKKDITGDSDILLTDAGKCYFEQKADRDHEKRIENIRYIITTAIAVVALIKSFLPEILEVLNRIFPRA